MRLAIKDLLISHAAEVLDVVAEHTLAASLTPTRLGIDSAADCDRRAELQRVATREAEAVIARERSGEVHRPPFRGVKQALQALDDARMDGAAIPPSPVWDLIVPSYLATPRTESARSVSERVVDVERHWVLCFAAGWYVSEHVTLPPWQARAVAVWSLLGWPDDFVPVQGMTALKSEGVRQQRTDGHAAMRLPTRMARDKLGVFSRHAEPIASDVAQYASGEFGVDVPVGDVMAIRRAGVVEMYGRLKACGLVPRDERLETMAQSDDAAYDLIGWKQIAAHLGVDERTAQRWQRDGLPIYDYQGSVVARRRELTGWQAAQMKPRRAG